MLRISMWDLCDPPQTEFLPITWRKTTYGLQDLVFMHVKNTEDSREIPVLCDSQTSMEYVNVYLYLLL